MGAILLLIIAGLLGWPLVVCLFKENSKAEKIALAWMFGSFLISWQLFILLFWLKLETRGWFNLIFLAEASLLFYFWKIKVSLADFKFSKEKKYNLLEKIIFGCIAGVVLFSFVNVYSRANIGWDSLSMWSLKAKQIYYTGKVISEEGNINSWQTAGFQQYPWHTSLLYLWGNKLNGYYSDNVSGLINWFYYLSIIVLVYGFLVKKIKEKGAAVFTLMLASAPLYYFHSFNVYSDLILGCYVALALIFLWQIMEGNKLAYIGLALSLTAAYTTKNEGIFILLAAALLVLLLAIKKRNWLLLVSFASFNIILLAPWQIFKFINKLGIANAGSDNIWHWGVFYQFFRTFWLNASFNIFAWVMLIVLIFSFAKILKDKKLLAIWSCIGLVVLAFLYVYLSSSSYQYALDDTALSRHLITLYPALIIATALSWQKIDNKII